MTIAEKIKQREAIEKAKQEYRSAIREKRERIKELLYNLNKTDYKAIKYAEGELSAEEYAPTLEQRKAWREEINALQAEIKAMASTI